MQHMSYEPSRISTELAAHLLSLRLDTSIPLEFPTQNPVSVG